MFPRTGEALAGVAGPAATVWYGLNRSEAWQALVTFRERAPMADKGNDPAVIWQTMLGEMEKGFNSFANQAMASPEFSKVMNQVGGVSAGAQKQHCEAVGKNFPAVETPGPAAEVRQTQ